MSENKPQCHDCANARAEILSLIDQRNKAWTDNSRLIAKVNELTKVLREHVEATRGDGDDEAATATGFFSDVVAPCECAGCQTFRKAVVLLGETGAVSSHE